MGTRPVHFVWSGEPVGTVSRELHIATLDGPEQVFDLNGRFSDTVNIRVAKGATAWAIVFRDKNGKALCSSVPGLMNGGFGGGIVANGATSLSSDSSNSYSAPSTPTTPTPPVSIYMKDGRLVIVLRDTPYTGQYTKRIDSDDYDGTSEDLLGASGLEIHGNNIRNVVTGSPGNDIIWLYGGPDVAEGGAGDDILVGGNGGDTLTDITPAAVNDTDTLYGGPGFNIYSVNDGDNLDRLFLGTDGGATSLDGGDTIQPVIKNEP
ncbi:MAG: hypothetical protein Devi2KO_34940 [Devosia indica]